MRWIVVDRQILGTNDQGLLERLLAGQFRVRYERQSIVVAQRVRAARQGEPGSNGTLS